MKYSIISLTILLSFISSWAQSAITWNYPVAVSDPYLKITKVEFADTATIVYARVIFYGFNDFCFPSSTKLIADGKDYAVKACSYAPIDSIVPVTKPGELDCTVSFAPLPSTTKSFAFSIQGDVLFDDVHDRMLSRKGIKDSYWRDDMTGDWLLGITDKNLIYDCKIWDISSMNEKKGSYSITAINNGEQIAVNIGKEKNSQRIITIGKQKHVCSIINSQYLPDYPEKDTRSDFADNHYRKGDSVTIVGWIRDIPVEKRDIYKEFKMAYASLFDGRELSCSAKLDSLGRFILRMPVENTTFCTNGLMGTLGAFILEPNETYFFFRDFKNDQTFFMGENARVLNEIAPYRIFPDRRDASYIKDFDAMAFLAKNDSIKNATMQRLDKVCSEHPTLSARFRTFFQNYILGLGTYDLMMACSDYGLRDYTFPEEYFKEVEEGYINKIQPPYTTCEVPYHFLSIYANRIEIPVMNNIDLASTSMLYSADRDGIIKLSDEDKAAINQIDTDFKVLMKKLGETSDSIVQDKLVYDYNNSDCLRKIQNILMQEKVREYSHMILPIRKMREEMKKRGWRQELQDMYICSALCRNIEFYAKPLTKNLLAICDTCIQLQMARDYVHEKSDKYESIGKMLLSEDNLKSNDIVNDMSEGEQIFRKLIEPYKGKVILIDVWGTWCGPCKSALSHSQEEYERLKPYDMVFMYLANDSPEKIWKNVIKEYNVVGDNVVHFNLPPEQQKSVEEYINVQGYPTYKLVDQNGNLLDVEADPRSLEALENLIKRLMGEQ